VRLMPIIALCALFGCVQTAGAYEALPLGSAKSPFYVISDYGNVIVYSGYGYDLSTFDVFAFDPERSAIVARQQFELSGVTSVCAGPHGVVLSRPEAPLVVSYRAGVLAIENAAAPCPDVSMAFACAKSVALFHGWLPGSSDQLSICYDPDGRETTFHITSAAGQSRDLGAAGTSPGGSGRFVVTRGIRPGTFLAHHTRSAIAESAVLIDTEADTVEPFDILDLSEARPSRGFGAGTFGVTLHPVSGGLVAEGEGGNVFLLKDGKTRTLVDEAVAQSVRVAVQGCSIVLVARADAGEELRVYDVCGG